MLLRDDFSLMLKQMKEQFAEQSAGWERSRFMISAGIAALEKQLKAMPQKAVKKEKVVKDGFIR